MHRQAPVSQSRATHPPDFGRTGLMADQDILIIFPSSSLEPSFRLSVRRVGYLGEDECNGAVYGAEREMLVMGLVELQNPERL